MAAQPRRQPHRLHEVGFDRMHRQAGNLPAQLGRRKPQEIARDVERHVGRRRDASSSSGVLTDEPEPNSTTRAPGAIRRRNSAQRWRRIAVSARSGSIRAAA
jgi:hypothetical protein